MEVAEFDNGKRRMSNVDYFIAFMVGNVYLFYHPNVCMHCHVHRYHLFHHSIDHFRITAIWPGDRIRRPEHPTENEVRRCSCDESV